MIRTLKDFRWHLRTRFARGLPLDGMIMGTVQGLRVELISPRWWDLPRWLRWLRADGVQEMVLHEQDGTPRFLRFRTRITPAPPPTNIRIPAGRTIVPQPVPRQQLHRPEDPRHRLVPDEVLERMGATHRED